MDSFPSASMDRLYSTWRRVEVAMVAPIATAAKQGAGSVGVVEAQYVDLPRPVRLDCGRELEPVRVAYETYGTLNRRRDNVILVCHALSGDAHAAGVAKT